MFDYVVCSRYRAEREINSQPPLVVLLTDDVTSPLRLPTAKQSRGVHIDRRYILRREGEKGGKVEEGGEEFNAKARGAARGREMPRVPLLQARASFGFLTALSNSRDPPFELPQASAVRRANAHKLINCYKYYVARVPSEDS